MKSRRFIDTATLYATAGNGGNGSASFRREKFVAKGGPDGGDGGRGGHVILRCNRDADSLAKIFFAPHQRAKHGGPGRSKKWHGANGKDCYPEVPPGTEVWCRETNEMLVDMVEHGQEFLVASGGKGGKGNVHWKSSTHQAPTEHTNGVPGEEITFRLKLKLIAGVGLVGYPNAGKSSLLSKISDAHPSIGAYPFTTLNPIIGTIIFDDYSKLTVADIPGLIEGAHEGVGLGHAFLRHVERAQIIVFIIDMAGVDVREPHHDYHSLINELTLYQPDLIQRPSIVVANKMDLPEAADKLIEFKKETGITPIELSTTTGQGIDILKQSLFEIHHKLEH